MWLARANPSRARFSSRDGLANVLFDYSGIGRPLPRKPKLQLKRLERARSFVKTALLGVGGAYLPVWLASSLAHWSNFSVRSFRPLSPSNSENVFSFSSTRVD